MVYILINASLLTASTSPISVTPARTIFSFQNRFLVDSRPGLNNSWEIKKRAGYHAAYKGKHAQRCCSVQVGIYVTRGPVSPAEQFQEMVRAEHLTLTERLAHFKRCARVCAYDTHRARLVRGLSSRLTFSNISRTTISWTVTLIPIPTTKLKRGR